MHDAALVGINGELLGTFNLLVVRGYVRKLGVLQTLVTKTMFFIALAQLPLHNQLGVSAWKHSWRSNSANFS
jgi:hypothetical protein